ncbi:MAG: cysteine hydrolase [Actinobacteria bacterium]|nr:cysteine hydrolase [Actinomycetota bacterium]
MEKYFFDFIPDKKGPHKISIKSYLEKAKLALLVIDMQNYMTEQLYTGKWSSRGSEDYYYNRAEKIVIPCITRLIDFFRKNRLKIVYTRIASLDENFADVPSTAKKNLVDEENIDAEGKRWTLHAGDRASFIEKRLEPASRDIIVLKGGSGAFCSSEMDLVLRSNNISRLVFTGGLTDACVSSSVRQAWDRGYLCTVAEDACIASCREDHEAEMRILGKYYAWITTADKILNYLNV